MLTRESLIEWAAHWVPDSPPGQRKRFTTALAIELQAWAPPALECQHDWAFGKCTKCDRYMKDVCPNRSGELLE
jgi:hypothetical protein